MSDFEPRPGRPVLLVTIDTLRADALGSYGAPTPTPALDRLAAAGVRFDNAVAHTVVTLPSHVSIHTGLDPTRHGVQDNQGYRLGDAAVTWAERLRDAGYATAAFVGAFPLDSLFGLSQGFDLYDDYYGAHRASDSRLQLEERSAAAVVEVALDWLEGRQGRWFAWVHVFDPHAPYGAPSPYGSRYADNPYAGEVAYVDSQLAPLLDRAREMDALVVVTSDHGEALGERGEETHGVFAYPATLEVPLIIGGLADSAAGTVVTTRVRHIDILPTVLEALGLPADGIQGTSLTGVAGGAPHPDPTSYFQALTPFLEWGWAPLRGIYSGDLKYTELPLPELYDTVTDANETDNLAERRNVDLARLAGELRAHIDTGVADAGPAAEDAATLRRLQALGYVGSEGTLVGDEGFGAEDDPKRLIVLKSMMQQATRAFEAGRFDEAVTGLQEVIARRPGLARAHTLLALVRERQAGPAAAIVVLEKALADGVVTTHVLARLATVYLHAGRFADAAAAAERSLAAWPDDVETMNLLATIYGQGGQPEAAEALLRRALQIDPTYALLHANLGTAMLAGDRFAEAERAFRTALEYGHRFAEAERAFRTALEYDPALPDAHNGLGVVANAAGDLAAAVDHWRAAVDSDPTQAFALYNMAVVLRDLGRLPEAIEALDRFVRLRPGDDSARAFLAQMRREVQP